MVLWMVGWIVVSKVKKIVKNAKLNKIENEKKSTNSQNGRGFEESIRTASGVGSTGVLIGLKVIEVPIGYGFGELYRLRVLWGFTVIGWEGSSVCAVAMAIG